MRSTRSIRSTRLMDMMRPSQIMRMPRSSSRPDARRLMRWALDTIVGAVNRLLAPAGIGTVAGAR